MACHRGHRLQMLGAHRRGPARGRRAANADLVEPLAPPRVAGVEQWKVRQIPRARKRPEAVERRRRDHRRKLYRQQPRRPHAGPAARARPDRQVEAARGQILERGSRLDPHGDIRMSHLERADLLRQPLRREGRHHRHRQDFGSIRNGMCEGLRQLLECLPDARRQQAAGLRKLDMAVTAVKQLAHPVFQNLDLIADGGLAHPELLGGAAEAEIACDRLEGAQGGQRRKRRHPIEIPYAGGKNFDWSSHAKGLTVHSTQTDRIASCLPPCFVAYRIHLYGGCSMDHALFRKMTCRTR